MKYPLLVITFLVASFCYSQTPFDRSEARFNDYLTSDSTKSKAELKYQRTHAGSRRDKIRYNTNYAVYYNHNNQFKLAEVYLGKASKLLQPADVDLEGELIRVRSLILFKNSRFKESNQVIEGFLKKHSKISKELLVDLQTALSANDVALGNYAQAQKRVMIAYKIFRKNPSSLTKASKLKMFSTLYEVSFYQAKYDSALYYIYQQEPLLEEGTTRKGSFYDRIAIVYTTMEQYDKAIIYHQKSIAILEKKNAPILLSYSLYNFGSTTRRINVDKSIPIFEQALKTARETGYIQIMGYALQELGDIYLTKKDYAIAEKYNREALEIMQKTGVDHGVITVLLNLGRQGYETGNFNEALKYLQQALEMTKRSDDIPNKKNCYEYLYNAYNKMGNYQKALYYYKLFAQTQAEIFRIDLQNNVDKLNLSYDVKVEQLKNKQLKKDVVLKNKQLSAEQKIKWLLGVLLLVLLTTGWFFRRLLMQRAHLKEVELQLAQAELKGVELEKEHTLNELDVVKEQLIRKNDLIGELNNLLKSEQPLISKEQFGSLVTNDNDWVQFLAKLQLLFPQFADNLKSRHPNLSNNEFRLSALVRLNLSDKEISALLIIEVSSVKKAKNRLKQKLGLDTNDKLDMYLGQL